MNDYRFFNYKLNKNITKNQLTVNGFYHNQKIVDVYKNLIVLKMYIENEDGKPYFCYEVFDVCNNSLYSPYYAGGDNENLVLKEVKRNVKKTLDNLVLAKVLRLKNEND